MYRSIQIKAACGVISAGLAFVAVTQAVTPAPDRGYPGAKHGGRG
jgi:hypothetical protein